jgi:HEAT repeat protein
MPEACRPHLPGLLADSDADVRLLSCELARGLPDEEANRLLCELLERESETNVCAAAVEVLAEIGRPEALPALARCGSRFAGDPFMTFSLKVATERIAAPARDRRE